MNWVTVIWSIGAGGCMTLALIELFVWLKARSERASLALSVLAISVAAFAGLELALMRAQTPEQLGEIVRWLHVPAWVMITSLVAFTRLYLRAGRLWLAWMVVGVRTLSLILNFVFSPNINFREITAVRHIPFLGETVSVSSGRAESLDVGRPAKSGVAGHFCNRCCNSGLAARRPSRGAGGGRQHCVFRRDLERASSRNNMGNHPNADDSELVLPMSCRGDGVRIGLRSAPRSGARASAASERGRPCANPKNASRSCGRSRAVWSLGFDSPRENSGSPIKIRAAFQFPLKVKSAECGTR